MVNIMTLLRMRTEFSYPKKDVLTWFPGHMGKGMKQMEQKLKNVDCLIEVHDARIPLIGRNPKFKYTITGLKPHILVLNKKDLSDETKEKEIIEKIKEQGIQNIVYTNSKDLNCTGLKKLIPMVQNLIKDSERYNRSQSDDLSAMILGIPNVGKSSLINALRNKNLSKSNAAPVGKIAGITRSLSSKIKISQNPLIYVLDTPGILNPHVENEDTALKLALISSMQDHLVGIELIADYLLYYLNKTNNTKYVEYLDIKEPTDNIMKLLILTSMKMNKTIKRRNLEGGYLQMPDVEFSAKHFVTAFRNGYFGKIIIE